MKQCIKRHQKAFICIAAGLACMAVGVWRDETYTILQKAIYICLECVGIG